MTFTPHIYDQIRAGCQRSAEIVAPRIDEIFKPETVIDVGGGEGWWAAEFATRDRVPVVVDPAAPKVTAPGVLRVRHISTDTGRFDLALCLEMAEHLPVSMAEELVGDLCDTAPVIVFSAAIPGQGGHRHIDEQWPQYWAELFAQRGYACSEDLRWEFWDDEEVEPWYRQNLLLFVSLNGGVPPNMLGIVKQPKAVVHPEIYKWRLAELSSLTTRGPIISKRSPVDAIQLPKEAVLEKPLRIAALMLVKDEEDVIGHNIYHLLAQGVDRVLVKDNLSDDRTRDILFDLVDATDGAVAVFIDTDPAYYQSKKTTALADMARKLGYDWVIPVDADEIWYSEFGTLRDIIIAYHTAGYDVLPAELFDHIPTGSDPPDADPFRRIGWRFREPGKLPKVAIRNRLGMVIEQGNHGAHSSDAWRQLRRPDAPALSIRHFSWRSPEQYVRKIRNGYNAYSHTNLDESVGSHWRMFGPPDEPEFEARVVAHFYEWFYSQHPEADEGLIYDPAPVADSA